QNDLLVFVDIAWDKQVCLLDSKVKCEAVRDIVRHAVQACAHHPAVFAFSVANELPADIVRWSGARAIARVIDDLITDAKEVDPHCLCTYTNFPPTEFLRPQSPDFICFNVYLHNQQPFESYLARLQLMADSKPLMLGELGIDSIREGEDRKCEMLSWQIESA